VLQQSKAKSAPTVYKPLFTIQKKSEKENYNGVTIIKSDKYSEIVLSSPDKINRSEIVPQLSYKYCKRQNRNSLDMHCENFIQTQTLKRNSSFNELLKGVFNNHQNGKNDNYENGQKSITTKSHKSN
jgi:hypothetical protein